MRLGSKVAVVATATVLFSSFGGASGMTPFRGSGSVPGDGGSAASDDGPSRAAAVAREVTGGVHVIGTEVDAGCSYDVQVALDDGRRVEVRLDEAFEVLGISPVRDGAGG